MRPHAVSLFVFALALFAQSDRGTITGTISDPAGAVVASAAIEARNAQTGALYTAASSTTGNYTLSQLPAGLYEMTVTVPGFKKYVRQNIEVQVAQTLRIDVGLEVGANTESVTVTAEVTLLKTESGELSHVVTTERLDNLPILNVSSGGIRNPYATTQLVPGATWRPNLSVRINGAPSNTEALRIEGQDSTNGLWAGTPAMTQPSVDAIQEFAIQTNNYAAEFGQAGGGLFNLTMRSGTNQFHGSAYEYFVNDALNGNQPFINARPVIRRNDYGFTLGGPVWIPKVYNGHDRTFFFLNWERYKDIRTYNNIPQTVPTAAYRAGDFSTALTGAVLGTDSLGRSILEGQVYDPRSQRVVDGFTVRDPFPGNKVDPTYFDPVAVKIQSYIPQPNRPGLTNNYLPVFVSPARTTVPAIKVDQLLGSRSKVSFYWSRTDSASTNLVGFGQADGFSTPITQARGSFTTANTFRLSYDQTISPTLLMHLGAGWVRFFFRDDSPELNFDPVKTLGLKGTYGEGRFPYFTGLCPVPFAGAAQQCGTSGTGGMTNMGPLAQSLIHEEKPTANVSVTWVRNNHTYKAGADMIIDGYPSKILGASVGVFNFSTNSTSNPYLILNNTSGRNAGFPYASFLLGAVDNGNIGLPAFTHLGSHSIALFVQDSWKVTRRLTLDYGLRWDYQSYLKDGYGRMPSFGFNTPNPKVGGRPGGLIFEGDLPGRCKCQFASNYPYAIGPRLGGAYQINSKTVLRAGFGIVYSKTGNNAFTSQFISSNNLYQSPGQWEPSTYLQDGVPLTPTWPNFDPGQQPSFVTSLGSVGTGGVVDRNAGRPARQVQWSISIQREIARNLAVEASYVGNRGAWWQANTLVDYNRLTPDILAAAHLDLNNAEDRMLLTSALSSPLAIARGFSNPPYPGFPRNFTVAQSLRPYPHFGGVNSFSTRWAPLGHTWYDSLQLKVTKRYSYGLDFTYTFAWQKELTLGAESEDNTGFLILPAVNDVLNREIDKYISGLSQPLQSVIAATYTTPKSGGNKALSWVTRDWTLSGIVSYRSGLPIQAPGSQNQLGGPNGQLLSVATSFMNRVPDKPLFTVDLNCHCYDPTKTFVLNKDAWANPPGGQFGTSAAYYNDYRFQRRPGESVAFGRTFRITERVNLNIRAEFTNIFNRTEAPDPVVNNALATQQRKDKNDPNSLTTGGFGFINVLATPPAGTTILQPRQGTLVARITF